MAETKKNESQSYGSQKEWVSGKAGGQVNDQTSTAPAQQSDFYENRRESEVNHPSRAQGGSISPVQLADNAAGGAVPTAPPSAPDGTHRIASERTGSKRDSYFRSRDYAGSE